MLQCGTRHSWECFCSGLDGPEGAEDVRDAVAEEGADESDVFGGDGLVSGEGGFATGEGNEAVVLEVDRVNQLYDKNNIFTSLVMGSGDHFDVADIAITNLMKYGLILESFARQGFGYTSLAREWL